MHGFNEAGLSEKTKHTTPSILLPGMTIEDVKSGVSKIRNRVVARVFRELDLIEQWGSGFRRILQEASELGLSEPVIEEIGMRVRVTIFLSEELVIQSEGLSRDSVLPAGTRLI